MPNWHKGDLVEFDGLLAVVVGGEGEPGVPNGHVALWFGEPEGRRQSRGGPGGQKPHVWLVPAEHCVKAAEPVVHH